MFRPLRLLVNKVAIHVQFLPKALAILPITSESKRRRAPIRSWTLLQPRRLCSLAFLMVGAFCLVSFLRSWRSAQVTHDPWIVSSKGLLPLAPKVWGITSGMALPPLYAQYHKQEAEVSRHNLETYKDMKFLYIGNHAWGTGFGNVMQEYMLNAVAAFAAGRVPVFDNYTWSLDPNREASLYEGKFIPSRQPLSVFLGGPITGSYPGGEPATITRSLYEEVCQGKKRYYDTRPFNARFGSEDGKSLLDAWVEELRSIDDQCLETRADTERPFDIWLFGSERLHSLMDTYLHSHVLRYFSFSPLIHDAFNLNVKLFTQGVPVDVSLSSFVWGMLTRISAQEKAPFGATTQAALTSSGSPSPHLWNSTAPLPGLLAIHVRRGDFQNHCIQLAQWRATFHGMNTMIMNNYSVGSGQEHPDAFVAPPGGETGQTSPENLDLYARRCFPSISQIVDKVYQIRKSYSSRQSVLKSSPRGDLGTERLSKIYVMTNAKPKWLNELRKALTADTRTSDPIEVHHSRELELTHEHKYVAQTLDMYIGARADVFIGNGWSSLTSNVVMLRMARGLDPLDTRFW